MATDIDRWIARRIDGDGGYKSMVEHEWGIETLHGAAAFVLRCLANPDCEGADEVLASILKQRLRVGQS